MRLSLSITALALLVIGLTCQSAAAQDSSSVTINDESVRPIDQLGGGEYATRGSKWHFAKVENGEEGGIRLTYMFRSCSRTGPYSKVVTIESNQITSGLRAKHGGYFRCPSVDLLQKSIETDKPLLVVYDEELLSRVNEIEGEHEYVLLLKPEQD